MIDTTQIANEGKDFELLIDGTLKSVLIKELTIKEKSALARQFEEQIKAVARKEALEIAKLMSEKEKNKYLIEVARANSKISEEEINNAAESVYGLIEILKIASKQSNLNWEQIYLNNIDMVGKAYFFALYGSIPEDPVETEKVDGAEPKQAEKF